VQFGKFPITLYYCGGIEQASLSNSTSVYGKLRQSKDVDIDTKGKMNLQLLACCRGFVRKGR
jgi:hypothetical protein